MGDAMDEFREDTIFQCAECGTEFVFSASASSCSSSSGACRRRGAAGRAALRRRCGRTTRAPRGEGRDEAARSSTDLPVLEVSSAAARAPSVVRVRHVSAEEGYVA
jgi:hypothetical protein